MTDAEVLRYVRQKLEKSFEIQKLILFGSRGRNSSRPESDYDILVVAESEVPFAERQAKALLALGSRSFPVDLLVYTPSELEEAAAVPGSAVYWALREGVGDA